MCSGNISNIFAVVNIHLTSENSRSFIISSSGNDASISTAVTFAYASDNPAITAYGECGAIIAALSPGFTPHSLKISAVFCIFSNISPKEKLIISAPLSSPFLFSSRYLIAVLSLFNFTTFSALYLKSSYIIALIFS